MRDRRQINRDENPAGAAIEAAIAGSIGLDGIPVAPPARDEADASHSPAGNVALGAATVGAIGVVFGDIGTNPLFALREAFDGPHAFAPSPANVLGVLSLVVWALLLVVTVKYVAVIMRADNRGEGGILALLALLLPRINGARARSARLMIGAGLIGASLLYGDGVITPAISVLSAVEGLNEVSPVLRRFVVPLTLVILSLLFAVQRHGTARVGKLFGPVMSVWFIVIGSLGAISIAAEPSVLAAFSPIYAVRFFARNDMVGIAVLGAVVLVVAGSEALYADMGHFGAKPIRVAWIVLVLPCLLLNYLGQGALLLRTPDASHLFFRLAPRTLLLPLVVLATATTVIASQALISGAFSLTRQLMHLGYSPLVTVQHTSSQLEGQIYVPVVNWLLFTGCVALVLGFGTSARLASSYGLAVSGTMAMTTILAYRVMRWIWRWPRAAALPLATAFLAVDTAFLVANVAKIPRGGWVPLVIAAVVCFVFATWHLGRARLIEARTRLALPLDVLIERVRGGGISRTPGTGVFLASELGVAPGALSEYVARIGALHEHVLLISIQPADVARVAPESQLTVDRLPEGFFTAAARYGYMQTVSLAHVLNACRAKGVPVSDPTYYVARERLYPTGSTRMARWRKRVFIFLHHNAPTMQDFFALPRRQVLELGLPIQL